MILTNLWSKHVLSELLVVGAYIFYNETRDAVIRVEMKKIVKLYFYFFCHLFYMAINVINELGLLLILSMKNF